MTRSRASGILLGSIGLTLLSWLLVDASSVAATLRLSRFVDEATVVLLGLAIVGACFVGSVRPLSGRHDSFQWTASGRPPWVRSFQVARRRLAGCIVDRDAS